MNRISLAGVIVVCCLVVAMAGCATGKKAVSDQDLVKQTLGNWKDAIETKNLDKMMANYSEKFTGENGGKAELRTFLDSVVQQGYLDGAKADLTTAKIDIKEGAATVGPIALSSEKGSVTATLYLKKEPDGVWRIVSSDIAQ